MSGNSTTQYQPDSASLIGGYPSTFDIAPCIILGIGYALAIIAFIYRQFSPKTRAILPQIHTLPFSIEHMIIIFVRVPQAHTTILTMNYFFAYWCQLTFAIGWINIINAIVNYTRCVEVNATLADEGRGSIDLPDERKRARRTAGLTNLALLVPLLMGAAGIGAHGNGVHSYTVIAIRYASTSIALVILMFSTYRLIGLKRKLAFVDEHAVRILLYMAATIMIVPVYRLTVMYNRTPNLPGTPIPDPSVPSSLSSNASKAAFYIFHLVPELVVVLWLHVIDVRATFNISRKGDKAWNDKKGIPRLLEKGQEVDGVGVEYKKATQPTERLGPYQGSMGNALSPQQDDDHAYASLLVPEARHDNEQARRDPWA